MRYINATYLFDPTARFEGAGCVTEVRPCI